MKAVTSLCRSSSGRLFMRPASEETRCSISRFSCSNRTRFASAVMRRLLTSPSSRRRALAASKRACTSCISFRSRFSCERSSCHTAMPPWMATAWSCVSLSRSSGCSISVSSRLQMERDMGDASREERTVRPSSSSRARLMGAAANSLWYRILTGISPARSTVSKNRTEIIQMQTVISLSHARGMRQI